MKKNFMMRAASVLLVAVMLTTCAISGTFAKYVTADEGSDTARVAKFGVQIAAKDFDMFAPEYDTTDKAKFSGEKSVSSDNGDDLLAPGTSGSFGNIAITGTPEVAVEVAIVPTVAITGDWIVDGDFYCPVVVKVNDATFYGCDYGSAESFATAIADNIKAKSAVYAAKTDLSAIYNTENLDISWAWAFEKNGEVLGVTCSKNDDVKDTKLGDRAVAKDLEIFIGVDITVTQID